MPKHNGSTKHCKDCPCKHSNVLIHFRTWYRAVSSDVPCWAVAGVIWHTDTNTTWRITDNCRKNRKILIVQHMLRICWWKENRMTHIQNTTRETHLHQYFNDGTLTYNEDASITISQLMAIATMWDSFVMSRSCMHACMHMHLLAPLGYKRIVQLLYKWTTDTLKNVSTI